MLRTALRACANNVIVIDIYVGYDVPLLILAFDTMELVLRHFHLPPETGCPSTGYGDIAGRGLPVR